MKSEYSRFKIAFIHYGQIRDMTYAYADNRKDAEALKATAISLGYRDARIVPLSKDDYA